MIIHGITRSAIPVCSAFTGWRKNLSKVRENFKPGLPESAIVGTCRTFDHEFDRGFTCVQYGLYERGLLMDYKYRGESLYRKETGRTRFMIACRWEEETFDLLVPVPMHRKSRRGEAITKRILWRGE